MVQVLEGEDAIAKNREVMGATDPKKAAKGTIRADLATTIDENVVHGSDAPIRPRAKLLTSSAKLRSARVRASVCASIIGSEASKWPAIA